MKCKRKYKRWIDYRSCMDDFIEATQNGFLEWKPRGNAWTCKVPKNVGKTGFHRLHVIVAKRKTRMRVFCTGKRLEHTNDPQINSTLIQAIVLGLNFKQ